MHQKKERHHITGQHGKKDDVDLVDVIQFLVDCVMAGLGRSGKYDPPEFPEGLLQKAFRNTEKKLLKKIEVVDE